MGQTAGAAKGRHPRFGADTGSGQDRHPASRLQSGPRFAFHALRLPRPVLD